MGVHVGPFNLSRVTDNATVSRGMGVGPFNLSRVTDVATVSRGMGVGPVSGRWPEGEWETQMGNLKLKSRFLWLVTKYD